MATFRGAAFQTRADYNFVSTFNLHKPQVDEKIYEVYGSQLLTSILEMVGSKKQTDASKYIWHEEDWIYPKIKATTAGAAAGATATFTIVAADELAINQNNTPYGGTSNTKYKIPVRVNDLIQVKPASGTVNSLTLVKLLVQSVTNPTASGNGSFTARALNDTVAIPAVTSDEIIITGNAHPEGSTQPLGLQSGTVEKYNNVQTIRETMEITGTEEAQILWMPITHKGKTQWYWSLKSEKDTYKRFLNIREMSLLHSEHLSNASLSDAYATSSTGPIMLTEGLIPFCLGGTTTAYSSVNGMTLENFKDLALELDANKGSKANLLMVGMDLALQLDTEMKDNFANGAINFGSFNFNEEKAINLEFSKLRVGQYTFVKKTYDAMNEVQHMGASGFPYRSEGMIIPMDNQMDPKSSESLPSIQMRYLKDREMKVEPIDLFKTGDDGKDASQVRYLSEVGFQGFGQKRFGYIYKS